MNKKSILLFAVCLGLSIFLAACTGETTTPAPLPSETYTLTPTASASPTQTPTPTEIPPQISIGMENITSMEQCNQISMDTLEQNMTALHEQSMARYRELGLIDANGHATDAMLSFAYTGILKDSNVPWSMAEIALRIPDARAITCNIIDGNLAFTVPMRAQGSNIIVDMTFIMDENGLKAWYGPEGVNSPEAYALKNTAETFKNILIEVQSGKPFSFSTRPWLLNPTEDNAGIMNQWESSKQWLDRFNSTGIIGIDHAPIVDPANNINEVKDLSTAELLRWFFASNDPTSNISSELQEALAQELSQRNPVLPIEGIRP